MTLSFKPLSIAKYDVFEAIVAVFFAIAVDSLGRGAAHPRLRGADEI